MDTAFKPRPGSYGETHCVLNKTVTATPITSGGTVQHYVAVPQAESVALGRGPNIFFYKDATLALLSGTAPAFTGTVTVQVVKRTTAGVVTPLSATASLTTGAAQFTQLRFGPLAGVTDAQRTINEGEVIGLQIVNAGGTVSTQPGAIDFSLRLAVLRG